MARVLFLMTHPYGHWKNGADVGTAQLAAQLEGRGHACRRLVLLRAETTDYAPPPGIVHRGVPTPPGADPLALARRVRAALGAAVAAELAAWPCDAVVVPWGAPALGALAAAAHPRVLVMVQNGAALPGVTPAAFAGVTAAAVSAPLAREVEARLGRPPLLLLAPVRAPGEAGDGREADDDVAVDRPGGDAFGMVNLGDDKGAVVFLHAAANLPDRRFVATAGVDASGAYWARVAARLPNVEVLPPRDDLRGFYDGLRALLVPSLGAEAFGRVALEAQRRGVPVVCTARCGAQDHVGGVVVPVPGAPDDPAEVAARRDGAHHAGVIRAFLDALVTIDAPVNHPQFRARARAAAAAYDDAQRASLAALEAWFAGG